MVYRMQISLIMISPRVSLTLGLCGLVLIKSIHIGIAHSLKSVACAVCRAVAGGDAVWRERVAAVGGGAGVRLPRARLT